VCLSECWFRIDQNALQIVNNCWNTKTTSGMETSVGQIFNLYLKADQGILKGEVSLYH